MIEPVTILICHLFVLILCLGGCGPGKQPQELWRSR